MSEQRFFKGDLVSFGIPPHDKIAEVVEVEEMHIVVKSVGGGLWSIDPYDTEAVRLYARKDARGHERITTLTAANAEVERLRAKLVESREQVADWMLKANDNFWSVTRLQAELASARAERDAAREIVEAFKAWRAAWDTFHIEADSTRADWSGSRVNLASLKVSQTRQHLDALLVASLKGGK